MTLNSKHITEKLKTKDTETRKVKTQKDESLVLPEEQLDLYKVVLKQNNDHMQKKDRSTWKTIL